MGNNRGIILIEPNLEGHHEFYLISFVKICLDLNARVKIVSNKKNRQYFEKLKETNVDLLKVEFVYVNYFDLLELPKNKIKKKIIVLLNFILVSLNLLSITKAVNAESNYLIFFCCIDTLLHDLMPVWLFDFLFPFKWNALTLISNDSKSISLFDRRRLFNSNNALRLYCLGEPSLCFKKNYFSKIYSFPDFADDIPSNRNSNLVKYIETKAKGRKIVSLLGAISFRKGVFTLQKTIQLLDSSVYFIVIAGTSFLSEKDMVKLKRELDLYENCFYSFERISSESDFNALIEISSVIYAAYINFPYSSNMLAKACLFKKQLIVSEGGYMAMIVDKFNLGIIINGNSSVQAASAIREISQCGKNLMSDFATYLKFNSKTTLYSIFKGLLNEE